MWRAAIEAKQAIGCVWAVTRYGYSYRYRLMLLALLAPALSVPSLLTPMVMQSLIDQAYPARDFSRLGWLSAALVALGASPTLLTALSGYLETQVRNLLQCRLCFLVFNALQQLPQSYREEHEPGMFLERATSDVRAAAQGVTELPPQIVTIGSTFLIAIPLMLRISAGITLLAMAAVPAHYLITVCLSRKLVKLHGTARVADERITTFLSETIEGATIAQLFFLNRVRRRKLKQLLRDRLHIVFATWRASTFWGQAASLVSMTWGLVLLCGGWFLVFSNRLQLGQAVALGMYINVLSRPFQQLATLYETLMRDSVAARRLLEILNVPCFQTEAEIPAILASPKRLELRQLSFAYREGRPCLRDVDLCLRAGETVAIVGPSGAGKSTLIRILCGLDDRYQGQLLVDGRDLRTIPRERYLRHVSPIPQTTFFFSDSVRGNLPGGNHSIPAGSMERCAALLGLDQVLDALPHGYETKLGSEGVRLSAGQYQKLAALRAVLKDASILLLDEITSSMDIESERRLLQGIVALRPADCITVFVTHRISVTTEPWIDVVVVLVDGRVAEKGTCAELRRRQALYSHWLDLSSRTPGAPGVSVAELAAQGFRKEPLRPTTTGTWNGAHPGGRTAPP